MSAVEVIDAYLAGLPGAVRRLGHAEWGLSLELEAAGGRPLDIGMRIADELLRTQALAVAGDPALEPWLFLHWNRQTRLVRFSSTRSGDVWVQGELAVAGLDEQGVDRLLGLLAQAAIRAREYAEAATAAARGIAPAEPTWLTGPFRPPAGD